jgi:hypothetical protein
LVNRLYGYIWSVTQVPEDRLRAGEENPAEHHHGDVEITDESLSHHLALSHGLVTPEDLSFGALQGIHDRFHGEAHAVDN